MSIKDLRSDPQKFRDNQKNRFSDPNIVDNVLKLDAMWLKEDLMVNKLNQFKNIITKHIVKVKNNPANNLLCEEENESFDKIFECVLAGKISDVENILNKFSENESVLLSKYTSTKIAEINSSVTNKNRDAEIHKLGNVLHKDVPIYADENNNTIVHEKKPTNLDKLKYNHVDLCNKLDFIDTARGVNLVGNRGYFLKGLAVKLNMALMMYASDFLEKKGYQQMYVPHLMNSNVMEKLCQLQDFDDTLYKVQVNATVGEHQENNTTKYLIATSEQPLTGYYMDYKFKSGELPIRFCGISTCYRKETGSHGKDTLGIFRVHQFEKIEQLCITEENESEKMFHEMIGNSKEFYDSLGLSYRVISIVSGALNNAAAIKYDLEGYFAGSGTYRELVSCSNCTYYFSRRLNIKDKHGKHVHILNSTLCANTRTLCCILEQYQTDKGVNIPEVLKPYMHNTELSFIPFKNFN